MEDILDRVFAVIESRKGADPASSYVASLHHKGPRQSRKKVVEEAAEFFEAAGGDDRKVLVSEAADLWFHSLVTMSTSGVTLADVRAELERRFGTGGHAEKASRTENKGSST